MKVTDIIIEFIISKKITDIFGYPGGVITHLMDSASKYKGIKDHCMYNEQGAAFAACGYAQASKNIGVAYSTSGPGATNMITGIANAYYDSIPVIFITGQVDTYSLKNDLKIRQRGFQETNVVSIVDSITKYSKRIESANDIIYYLEKAYYIALEGNPGPVLLDIPADIQRSEVDYNTLKHFFYNEINEINDVEYFSDMIVNKIIDSKRPCFLFGNSVKQYDTSDIAKELIKKLRIPVVTTLPSFDFLDSKNEMNFGFIGTNGNRYSNFIIGKCDLLITFGARLDIRQVGLNRKNFCNQANIIRIDIDKNELDYTLNNEIKICCNIREILLAIKKKTANLNVDFAKWIEICNYLKNKLYGYDFEITNDKIGLLSEKIQDNSIIVSDVGQHEIWIAQSFNIKPNQNVLMSAGHGSMGYSLPAAIGAYYGCKKNIYCFAGDGGLQMNIQELQFINRERIPINIICINNSSLGMIRGFQELNFNKNYVNTTFISGYTNPDFSKIAYAYSIDYLKLDNLTEIKNFKFSSKKPVFIELVMPNETILKPSFGSSAFIQDQKPYLDRKLYNELMNL